MSSRLGIVRRSLNPLSKRQLPYVCNRSIHLQGIVAPYSYSSSSPAAGCHPSLYHSRSRSSSYSTASPLATSTSSISNTSPASSVSPSAPSSPTATKTSKPATPAVGTRSPQNKNKQHTGDDHHHGASTTSSSNKSHTSASSVSNSSTLIPFTCADIRAMKGFVVDMDGVLYHMQKVIPGALDFIAWLKDNNKEFLFLTNSSERSPRELQEKLGRMGIEVGAAHFYTSALATASFLDRQKPRGTAYVIGEPGLISALYDVGYSMNDSNPDYVVVGETRNYSYAAMELAVKLVRKGARLIGTNCDITDRSQDSFVPACGSLIRPIEMAAGRQAYFIGKPNPLIMRAALSKLCISRTEACILGDRMDTDILAGIQSEIRTVLILTGVTAMEDLNTFPYRPDAILPSVGHILQDNCEVYEPIQERY